LKVPHAHRHKGDRRGGRPVRPVQAKAAQMLQDPGIAGARPIERGFENAEQVDHQKDLDCFAGRFATPRLQRLRQRNYQPARLGWISRVLSYG
jgi:hypothetical protein